MKSFLAVAVAVAFTSLVSCKKEDAAPPAPASGSSAATSSGIGETAKKVASEASDAAAKVMDDASKAATEAAAKAKKDAIASYRATLDELKPRLDQLRTKGDALDPLKKAAFDGVFRNLSEQYAGLNTQLGAMDGAADWEALSKSFLPMVEQLKTGLTKASALAGG